MKSPNVAHARKQVRRPYRTDFVRRIASLLLHGCFFVGVIVVGASCSSDKESVPVSSGQGAVDGQPAELSPVESSAAEQQPAKLEAMEKDDSKLTVVSLPDMPGAMDAVVLFPDGSKAASCGEDGKIHVYQVPTHEVVATFDGFAGTPLLAVSADGRLIAQASGDDVSVKVWKVEEQKELKTLEGHVLPISDIAFSPNGAKLATASTSPYSASVGELKLWNLSEDTEAVSLKPNSGILGIAFSPDGEYLASAGRARPLDGGGTVAETIVWDLKTNEAKTTTTNPRGHMHQVVFSPDGTMLAFAESNGPSPTHMADCIRFADPQTGESKGTLFGHVGKIQGIAYSPDGQYLVSAGLDGHMRVWQVAKMSLCSFHDLNGYSGSKVTFSRSGDRFAIACGRDASEIHPTVWDFEYALQAEPTPPGKDPFYVQVLKSETRIQIDKLVYSSDGRRLAILGRTAGVWVYDTASWKGRRVPGSTAVQPRDISPDLTKAAVLDKTLVVWNVDNLQEIYDFQDPVRTPFAHGVLDAVFSPDGRHLVSTHTGERLIKVRDVHSQQLVAAAYQSEGSATCIAYSADGTRLATGSPFMLTTATDGIYTFKRSPIDYRGQVSIWATQETEVLTGRQMRALYDTIERKVSPETRQAFAKALSYFEQGAGERAYAKALQPVIAQLTEINVSTKPNEHRWQRLTLNTAGERLDAVRFKTPDDEASFDLMWTVVFAPEIVDCCLLPTTGERLEATERFVYARPTVLRQTTRGTLLGGDLARLIESPGIQPGKEYMICFVLSTKEPVDTTICIKRMPKGSFMQEGWCPFSDWQSADMPMLRRKRVLFHGDRVTRVALSPDGSKAASIGHDGLLKLWDIGSGETIATYASEAAEFSLDGRVLATTGAGEEVTSIILRDVESGDRLRVLSGGHIRRVTALAFSPGGRRLASGGSDGLVTVWDPETGEQAWDPSED